MLQRTFSQVPDVSECNGRTDNAEGDQQLSEGMQRRDAGDPGDEIGPVCRALARRLIEDVERLQSAVGPRVAQQPLYASLYPEEAAEVARSTGRIAETLTACMAEGRRLLPAEARTAEVLGRRRAELGIPLDSVIGAIEQGAHAGHELLQQHAAAWPDPRVALHAFAQMSRNLFSAVHETTALVTAGYRDEEQERATHLVHEQATFVEELLGGAWVSSEAIIARGQKLGFTLTSRCALVLILPGTPRDAPKLKEATARFVSSLGSDAITGPLRHGSVVHSVVLLALPVAGAELSELVPRLTVATRQAGVVSLVEPVDDLTHVAPCYEAMRAEAAIAAAVTRSPQVLLRDDLLEYRVLHDVNAEVAFEFIDAHLGPVLSQAKEATVLVTTLETLLASDEPVEVVAKRLHLSHSGLRYRLRRISELTGLNWNARVARHRLQLSLHLYRLHESRLPVIGERWRVAPLVRAG